METDSLPSHCHLPGQPATVHPSFQLDSSEENWSGLCSREQRVDASDAIKYISLGHSDKYLSFGGEFRAQYELYRDFAWGQGPQSADGYYLERFLPHADLHLGNRLRFYSEFTSSLEFGRNGGPRPGIDEDKLDVSQAVLEFAPLPTRDHLDPPVVVKLGRQELNYGDGTLLATQNLNVRRPFDGLKLVFQQPSWRLDLLAAKPVITNTGYFDDVPDHTQTFWGAWFKRAFRNRRLQQLDIYYLGLDRKNAAFTKSTEREERHTIGVNAHEKDGGFSFFQEADLQIGSFGDGRLVAWKLVQGVDYAPVHRRFSPDFSLRGAAASGDRNPNSPGLQTFYPLFPNGLYYGWMVFTSGSANTVVLHPSVNLQLSRTLNFNVDHFSLWRESLNDGLYGQIGQPLPSKQTSQARYIGSEQNATLAWQIDRHITLMGIGSYYETGPYVRATQTPGKNATYFSVMTSYRF